METLSQKFGDDYMIILTSDHGFGPGLPSPKKQSDERRHDLSTILSEINIKLGVEGLVEDIQYLNVYLDEDRLRESGKTLNEICTAFSSSYAWIEHCLTTEDLSLAPGHEAGDRDTPSSAE